MSNFPVTSWQEQVAHRWDDDDHGDDVRFVLDQHP
jgi:hypothetical protein